MSSSLCLITRGWLGGSAARSLNLMTRGWMCLEEVTVTPQPPGQDAGQRRFQGSWAPGIFKNQIRRPSREAELRISAGIADGIRASSRIALELSDADMYDFLAAAVGEELDTIKKE